MCVCECVFVCMYTNVLTFPLTHKLKNSLATISGVEPRGKVHADLPSTTAVWNPCPVDLVQACDLGAVVVPSPDSFTAAVVHAKVEMVGERCEKLALLGIHWFWEVPINSVTLESVILLVMAWIV